MLLQPKLAVDLAALHQHIMRPDIDHLAFVEHENVVALGQRGQAVGDDHHRAAMRDALNIGVHQCLGLRIERAGGLIQNQQARIVDQRPGNRQLLLFTTGVGNSYVSALAPTIKISANPTSGRVLKEQLDFDASIAFLGRAELRTMGEALFEDILAIASGQATWGEILGEGDEVISRFGPAL